ncbi:MAG: hypothetical protein ABJD11_13155 [Gemmatimonadota bacterium]
MDHTTRTIRIVMQPREAEPKGLQRVSNEGTRFAAIVEQGK